MRTVLKITIDKDDCVVDMEEIEMSDEQIEEIDEPGTEFLYDDNTPGDNIEKSLDPDRCSLCNENNEVYMYFSEGIDQWVYDAFKAGSLRFSPC